MILPTPYGRRELKCLKTPCAKHTVFFFAFLGRVAEFYIEAEEWGN